MVKIYSKKYVKIYESMKKGAFMELKKEKNRIFFEDEKNKTILAEITFPDIGEGLVDINHTYVSDTLRGQGIASLLVQEVVDELRLQHKTCITSCVYAKAWFKRHPKDAAIWVNQKQ